MTMEQRMDRLEKRNKRLTATPMVLPLAMCAVLALSGLPTEIQAQVENTQSIGFVAGSTHGIGVSYARQNSQTGYGWQVSGFPVWSQGERHLFGAVALFKTLNQGKKGRAFLSFGVAAHYNRSIYEDEHGQIHISNGDDESYGLIFGPGVGLERWFAENFAVSLEIPAAIRVDSDEGFSILPIPNCALAYRW
jgi:hypothetical protein